MIPYAKQVIDDSDIQAVMEVLQSNYLTQGENVPLFEEVINNFVGAKYSVAVNSATSALHIAYLALGVGPGDIVWTSPITFVSTSNAAIFCGAKVDFVDIDPRTYNLSVSSLEVKLEKAIKKNELPKVIVPVHFAGQSSEMKSIYTLAKKYGVRVVEDASHSIGGEYLGKKIGCCEFSDITVFSFHPVKIITTGEGGIALTNQSDLADSMQRLRSHGILSNPQRMLPKPSNEIWNYQQVLLGYNYRLTDIQAALGISQMKKISTFLLKRREISKIYNTELINLPITLPWQNLDTLSSFHLYPILINPSNKISQIQVYNNLKKSGINVNIHYIPVYKHPYYQELGFSNKYCEVAENYFQRTISLPIFPNLSSENQEYIIQVLHKIFK